MFLLLFPFFEAKPSGEKGNGRSFKFSIIFNCFFCLKLAFQVFPVFVYWPDSILEKIKDLGKLFIKK